MATIKLTDQLGLDLDAQLAPSAALLKYLPKVPFLRIDTLDARKTSGLTLDEPAVHSFSTGVSFASPVDFGGEGAPALSVSAGAHGSLQIVRDMDDVPGAEAGEAHPNACYVAFGIVGNAGAKVSVTTGAVCFGASPSTQVELSSYSRFPLETGVTLLDAVRQTVAGFSIPASSEDLAALMPGQVAKVAVDGKLALSGSAELFATANPLASAKLPAPLPAVSVSAGGSATVGVSCEIEAQYEVVARKLDSGAVRLGWHRKRATEVTVTAKASEGISVGFGDTELFSKVITAISANPEADLQELTAAGLGADEAAAIHEAVKAAAARKLEIAVAAAFSASDSHSAAFLYEIAPGALDDESRQAVDRALRGDLTAIHAPGLAGVVRIRSAWEDVRTRGVELSVNLLGILNFRSISKLCLEGKVLCEYDTGELVITDKATAESIRSVQFNFGADTQKLRQVLAESFLITAAYHGSRMLSGTATLRCSHSFFSLDAGTDRGEMACKLRTGVALGLLASDEPGPSEDADNFGRTLFTVATDYDAGLVDQLFLNANGEPRPLDDYEGAGRQAIRHLVREGDFDAARLRPANDDGLWRQMKELGQPGIPRLFHGVADPVVAAIGADYTAIRWWADTMRDTAEELATVRLWLARHPTASLDDAEFQELRTKLAGYLRQVAAKTDKHFGQPWGLIAMYQLVGRRAGAKLMIAGPMLVRDQRRALTAVTRP